MSNFRRMHIIAGTTGLAFILFNVPMLMDSIQNDWKKAIELLSTLAIGGYLCGCVLGAVVNLGLYLWQKK